MSANTTASVTPISHARRKFCPGCQRRFGQNRPIVDAMLTLGSGIPSVILTRVCEDCDEALAAECSLADIEGSALAKRPLTRKIIREQLREATPNEWLFRRNATIALAVIDVALMTS